MRLAQVIAVTTLALVAAGLTTDGATADSAPEKGTRAVVPYDPGLATSANRLDWLDQARKAVEASPQRYGGVATAGDADVSICDNGGPPNPAMDSPVAALRASGARVAIHPCKYNLAELTKILPSVPTSGLFAENGVTLRGWGIDFEHDAVMIGVDHLSTAFVDAVARTWGDAAFVIVKPEMHLQ